MELKEIGFFGRFGLDKRNGFREIYLRFWMEKDLWKLWVWLWVWKDGEMGGTRERKFGENMLEIGMMIDYIFKLWNFYETNFYALVLWKSRG